MAAVADETKLVPLKSLFIAAENPRANVEPDAGIPQLGRTLVACQVYPILARPAGKGEQGEYGAIDGRRRYLGYQSALAEGLITEDHLVAVTVITDKARQNAAITLANHEREAGHITDVIMAIGRMRKAKLKSAAIADALGYTEMQIRRWTKLADLQPSVLQAMRADKIKMQTAQLMTRLSPEAQDEFAERALTEHHGNIDYYVRSAAASGAVTVEDDRFGLVPVEDYTAAGGKLESDLFGATPDEVLDPELLQRLWAERSSAIATGLEAAGLTVSFGDSGYYPPAGFERLPYSSSTANHTTAERRSYEDARGAYQRLAALYSGVDENAQTAEGDDSAAADEQTAEAGPPPTVLDLLLAELELSRRTYLKSDIAAVVLTPDDDYGLRATFHARPAPVIETADDAEDDDEPSQTPAHYRAEVAVPEIEVDVDGVNNSLHERYTVVATRGLSRTLADDPNAAFILLVARLFVSLAIPSRAHQEYSISTIRISGFSHAKHKPIGELDGEVYERLVSYKEAYMASELRPIPWVESLSHGERMTLMTQLVALSLDGKEFNTGHIRRGARAEAAELVELTGHDITNFWTPDAEFFAAHSKKQLLPMLPMMGVEDDPAHGALKKPDLAGFAAETAESARWAPAALSWKQPEAELVDLDEDAQIDGAREPEADGDHQPADAVANNDDVQAAGADIAADSEQADLAA